MTKILIVDDNEDDRNRYVQWLSKTNDTGEPVFAADLPQANEAIQESGDEVVCALVLWELRGPNSGADIIGSLNEQHGCTLPLIAVTGCLNTTMAGHAARLGAADLLTKPLARNDVVDAIHGALRQWSGVGTVDGSKHGIIGTSPKLKECLHRLSMVAKSDGNVLLLGETGTEKNGSPGPYTISGLKKDGRLWRLMSRRCSALIESELFGHEKGAFTGATSQKLGCFERCGSGTLFLDEIGELDIALQSKLLRVLQERRFERMGGVEVVPFKARLVCATHRDLFADVTIKRFREDLYYRLDVHTIHVPPLRQRDDDWRLLVEHFLDEGTHEVRHWLARDTEQLLKEYDFPGNVRELEAIIKAAKAVCPGGPIRPCHLPIEQMARRLDALRARAVAEGMRFSEHLFTITHRDALTELEQSFDRAYLPRKLQEAQNIVARAAVGWDADTFQSHWEKAIGPWKDRPK